MLVKGCRRAAVVVCAVINRVKHPESTQCSARPVVQVNDIADYLVGLSLKVDIQRRLNKRVLLAAVFIASQRPHDPVFIAGSKARAIVDILREQLFKKLRHQLNLCILRNWLLTSRDTAELARRIS